MMRDYSEEQRKMDRLEAENYEAYIAMGEVEI